MTNILVTGAQGQIGTEIKEQIESKHIVLDESRFYFTNKQTLDITKKESVEIYVDDNSIDIIINCAAYTDVDRAEREPETTNSVNHLAVKYLAEISKAKDIQLIHISTDYVFDGSQYQPYSETDTPNPQGTYSRSKLMGEEEIERINPPSSIIIRTSWVYSHYGRNFVKTMTNLGKERSSLKVVYDQIGTPTYATDLAETILHIVGYQMLHPETKKSSVEIYHYSNEGVCSWYDYSKAIFDISTIRCGVKPIRTQDYPTPAKRPLYSVLSKEKIKKEFNIQIPFWRDSLENYLKKERENSSIVPKVAVIGTGFIAKGLVDLLANHQNFELSGVLTRTDISGRKNFPQHHLLTNSLDDLIKNSDLIVECSGDALYATETIYEIIKADIPVVTMNSEFHITTGSYFVDKGLVTEAEGDQPGVQAVLHEEALSMGFKPLVYANIKGFLNHNPSIKEMEYWGKRSNISLDMVTSFTDGTKVQIEQVLVANGLDAGLIEEGLVKLPNDSMLDGGTLLAEQAKRLGYPVSDYLLSPTLPAGVFLVVEHDREQKDSLKYYKMGEGPYYVLERTYHLCHLEIIKTIERVLSGGGVLLDNSADPRFSVATIAKRDLKPGEKIGKGIGSFDVRGVAMTIEDDLSHVPIGLISDVTLKRDIKEGERIRFDDVEIPESLALSIWKELIERLSGE
ncbi:MAG: dTDP-4-dehydrorhamnose reductase [Campylobacterota bacterium]|nr:dTDP-4-dehydrorhamnose reductase [Campylobacterota bacterium]